MGRVLPLWGAVGLSALAGSSPLLAQTRGVQVRGGLTVSSDLYSQTGRPFDTRPGASVGANGQVTVSLPGGITLPFSAYASSDGVGYQHPFNQLGVSPRWRWAQAHAGYFSTRLSNLTLADARLLGGGVELTPGAFRFGVAHGQAQRAVEADSLRGRMALFDRRLTAVQLGVGQESGWHLWLSGLRAVDDSASLRLPTRGITPEENLVAAVNLGGRIGRYLRLGGEIAASAWNGDLRADSVYLEDAAAKKWVDRVAPFFRVTEGTRVDVAGAAQLTATPVPAFSVGFQTQYAGPGFRSLGAQQLETDVLDFTVAPTLRLQRVQAGVRVGLRRNNVAGTRLDTRRRALYAANVVAQLTPQFSLALDGSNFGLEARRDVDTLRLASISRAFSVAPTYALRRGAASHTFSSSYAYQDFSDENTTSGRTTTTRNHTVTATHAFVRRGGLRLTTTASFVRGLTQDVNTTVWTVSENVQHKLRGDKLTVGGGLTFTSADVGQTDRGLSMRARAAYQLTSKTTLEASSTGRLFRYGAPRNGQDGFREGTFRLAYSYSF